MHRALLILLISIISTGCFLITDWEPKNSVASDGGGDADIVADADVDEGNDADMEVEIDGDVDQDADISRPLLTLATSTSILPATDPSSAQLVDTTGDTIADSLLIVVYDQSVETSVIARYPIVSNVGSGWAVGEPEVISGAGDSGRRILSAYSGLFPASATYEVIVFLNEHTGENINGLIHSCDWSFSNWLSTCSSDWIDRTDLIDFGALMDIDADERLDAVALLHTELGNDNFVRIYQHDDTEFVESHTINLGQRRLSTVIAKDIIFENQGNELVLGSADGNSLDVIAVDFDGESNRSLSGIRSLSPGCDASDFILADLHGGLPYYVIAICELGHLSFYEMVQVAESIEFRDFSADIERTEIVSMTAGNVVDQESAGFVVGFEELIVHDGSEIAIYTLTDEFVRLATFDSETETRPILVTGDIDADFLPDLVVVSDSISIYLTSPESHP